MSEFTQRFDQFFELTARGSTLPREARAGLVTFLAMAYILAVNPQILAEAGMPPEDVFFATAVASAIGCFLMGLWARYPFALAPGMGLNAYFTFGVVLGLGVSWQTALTAVFVEGLLFLVLSLTGVRTLLVEAMPQAVHRSIPAGIGLFLIFVGLQSSGLVVDHPATLVTLGELGAGLALLSLGGLLLIGTLLVLRRPAALLIGITAVTLLAWALSLQAMPERWVQLPSLPSETLFAIDWNSLFSGPVLGAILAFLLVDLLDTAGTLVGVSDLGGFQDPDGRLPRSRQAFAVDAVATTAGALVGTSTTTTYIESAAGIEEGGRTGIVAVVVGLLFLCSLFFAPVILAIPAAATAPALIVVGVIMVRALQRIEWQRVEELLPAVFTAIAMPLTYSIANGLAAGILTWIALRILSGRWREVSWSTALLGVAVTALILVRSHG